MKKLKNEMEMKSLGIMRCNIPCVETMRRGRTFGFQIYLIISLSIRETAIKSANCGIMKYAMSFPLFNGERRIIRKITMPPKSVALYFRIPAPNWINSIAQCEYPHHQRHKALSRKMYRPGTLHIACSQSSARRIHQPTASNRGNRVQSKWDRCSHPSNPDTAPSYRKGSNLVEYTYIVHQELSLNK